MNWKKLFQRYKITEKQYVQLKNKQRGRCRICSRRKKLVVDHCHKTNKIRGLICNNCNLLLGHAKDEPLTLLGAINYLL